MLYESPSPASLPFPASKQKLFRLKTEQEEHSGLLLALERFDQTKRMGNSTSKLRSESHDCREDEEKNEKKKKKNKNG